MKLSLVFIAILFLSGFHVYSHPSWGIRVDEVGNIYFPDIAHNQRGSLWKLTPAGKLTLVAGDFHAHNVSLDNEGNPVSAHGEENHTMIRFLPGGKKDTLFHGLDYKQFFGGNATFWPGGEIIFGTQHYIWLINSAGKRKKFNDHRLEWSQTVYADESGEVYVPEIGYGEGKVYRLTRKGEAVLLADKLITKSASRPYDKHNDVLLGITKGCDGHIYVCETAGRRIVKITSPGKYSTFYQPEDGWTPCGVDFFQGDAYILEYDLRKRMKGPRIVKISELGKRSVLFDYDSANKSSVLPFLQIGEFKLTYIIAILLLSGLVLFTGYKFGTSKNT